jgi:predicted metal-dependent phosphoesterase TrpH
VLKSQQAVEMTRAEQVRTEAEKQAVCAAQEKLEAEKATAEQVIARAHADRQHVSVLQARQQQESEARTARQALIQAEQARLQKMQEHAELQKQAASAAQSKSQKLKS